MAFLLEVVIACAPDVATSLQTRRQLLRTRFASGAVTVAGHTRPHLQTSLNCLAGVCKPLVGDVYKAPLYTSRIRPKLLAYGRLTVTLIKLLTCVFT